MPRNSAGVYTLPPTNPVVPFTTIATAWANPTLSDIATELTNSLDRTGRGGMLAPFRIFDGSVSSPGLAFTNETSMGLWRPAAGQMNAAVGGASIWATYSDRFVSLLKLEHRGLDVYKTPGQRSWKIADESGDLIVVPSATIDAEDWDATKSTVFFQSGTVGINGTLSLGNGFSVTGDVNINGVLSPNSIACVGAAAFGGLVTANAGITSAARITLNNNTTTSPGQSGIFMTRAVDTTYWYAGLTPTGAQYIIGLADVTGAVTRTDVTIGKGSGNVSFQGNNLAKAYGQSGFAATWAASMTLDYNNGQSQILTPTATTTITAINNLPNYTIRRLTLLNTNFAITWPAAVAWPGGIAPTLASGPLKKAIVVLQPDTTGAILGNFVAY